MAIGKKEQIAVILVAAIAVAALVHFFVFAKRAETYKSTQEQYNAGVQTLTNAEFITEPEAFARFEQQTGQFGDMVTSVVTALNLQPAVKDPLSSPPLGAVDQWASETITLVRAIMDRSTSQRPRLTFLGGQRDQWQRPLGWNLARELTLAGNGAPADRAMALVYAFSDMQRSSNATIKYQSRVAYNQALEALGLPPQDISFFRMQLQNGFFYFDKEDMVSALNPSAAGQNLATQMPQYYNHWGMHTMGVAIPAIKKIWAYELIRQRTAQVPNFNMQYVGLALDINIPLETNALDVVNKQLRTVVDIIDLATRNQIDEITQIKLLRPVDLVKGELRQPGVVPSPTPAGTPAPNAGMGMAYEDPAMLGMYGGVAAAATPVPAAEKIGTGTGVEVYFRGTNNNVTKFLYDLTHITRTYSIDDAYLKADQNAVLTTSVTVELVTQVDKLAAGATPAAEVPVQ